MRIWPGYFDMKISRRNGRRVPKDSSVLKPDLEGLFMAARQAGLKKIKREEHTSHPSRPHGKEGRLWVSASGAKSSIGAVSKEELSCNSSEANGGKCNETSETKLKSRRHKAHRPATAEPVPSAKAPTQQTFGRIQKAFEIQAVNRISAGFL